MNLAPEGHVDILAEIQNLYEELKALRADIYRKDREVLKRFDEVDRAIESWKPNVCRGETGYYVDTDLGGTCFVADEVAKRLHDFMSKEG
jgi:hypothetical protein